MTFLFLLFALLSVVFWIISIIFNDIEDGLQYVYESSIFDWILKDSWWSWYMQDPDDTWKRKYYWNKDDTEIIGRKTWMWIPIPAFIYDGWHGSKILRQLFQYLTVFSGILAGGFLTVSLAELIVLFLAGIVVYGTANHFVHNVYFFDGMIRKKWWIERGKESVIKNWLIKHF